MIPFAPYDPSRDGPAAPDAPARDGTNGHNGHNGHARHAAHMTDATDARDHTARDHTARANGHANGHANAAMNGHANRYTNKYTNGYANRYANRRMATKSLVRADLAPRDAARETRAVATRAGATRVLLRAAAIVVAVAVLLPLDVARSAGAGAIPAIREGRARAARLLAGWRARSAAALRGLPRSSAALLRTSGALLRTSGALLRRAGLEALAVLALLAAGTYLRANNLFSYPRYQLDEGTYISNAWAVAHGAITPYTYTYGHPPAGWAVIAVWLQATGGFFDFGTAIDSGRVFMVWLAAFSGVLLYLIARRLSGSAWVALVALTIDALSPLAVSYQRQVLLDNVATFWLLLGLYFLVASESRLRYLIWSALALGLAVLSKETFVIFIPVFFYGAWLQASRFQRRFALVVFGYTVLAIGSAFVLFAALKGELLPQGLLPGDTSPHVSLLQSYLYQAGRGATEGAFGRQWAIWWQSDALFVVVGIAALAGNALLAVRRPGLRVVVLLSLLYWLFLARGGVTLAYYILPLIPLQALNIALFCRTVVAGGVRLLGRAVRGATGRGYASPRWLAPAALLVLLALTIPGELRANRTNLTADETGPQVAAMQWIGAHLPRSAVIVVNSNAWLDMSAVGGMAVGSGAPFAGAQMYWEVATDPQIKDGLLHDDWNNVDYVVADSDLMTDAQSFHMDIILQALQHATAIQTFQNPLYWVTIYEVRHHDASSADGWAMLQAPGAAMASAPSAGAAPGGDGTTSASPRPPATRRPR